MTDIAALQSALLAHAGELREIAHEIARMVPESRTRDDLMLAAKNAAFAGANRTEDAAKNLTWAIRREMGGRDDGQD